VKILSVYTEEKERESGSDGSTYQENRLRNTMMSLTNKQEAG